MSSGYIWREKPQVLLRPRISVLSQPQAREDPTTQFKPWQSPERPHRIRFLLLLNLVNALDVRTGDRHGCLKYWPVVKCYPSVQGQRRVSPGKLTRGPRVPYEYILLQMLRCDGLMEKDSGKLLWKSH